MSFETIIGNQKNKQLLTNIIKNKQIPHSYLFIGKDGIGKKLFAKEFAKMLLCSNEQKPCNKCKSCIEIENSNNPDFNVIEPEKNSIKIEQIRTMNKQILEKPIISDRKIYIIDNSELMTQEAQNCLLKTLEEPPEYAIIILITSNETLFLDTIISRCTKIYFEKLTNSELAKILKQDYSEEMYELFDGSIGEALKIIEKDYTKINEMLLKIDKIDLLDFLEYKDIIFKDKEDVETVLNYINVILSKKGRSNLKYIEGIRLVEEAKKRIKSNSNFDMTIDNLMISLWEEINENNYRS